VKAVSRSQGRCWPGQVAAVGDVASRSKICALACSNVTLVQGAVGIVAGGVDAAPDARVWMAVRSVARI
jgi:hypothetical protein